MKGMRVGGEDEAGEEGAVEEEEEEEEGVAGGDTLATILEVAGEEKTTQASLITSPLN